MSSKSCLCAGVLALLAAAAPLVQAAGALPAALQRPALTVARPTAAHLLAIARAGERLVAVGERGLVIYTDDAGRHWTQAKVPVSVSLTAVRFANGKEGWAAGNMGAVLRTTDGGASWTRVFDGLRAAALAEEAARQAWDAVKPDPAQAEHPLNLLLQDAQRFVDEGADKPFLDIGLRPDGSVLVVGAYGLAFSSSDGGASWQAQMRHLPNPEGGTYYGIAERQHEQFLFGEQGLLLRAAGQGMPDAAAFAAQASPAKGSLFGALPLQGGALVLFGLRGKVLRSARPGAPWQEVATPVDASLLAGLQLPDETVLLLGAAGQVVASRDQGQTFAALPMNTRFPFTGAALAPDGGLLITGTRGLLRLSPAELARALAPQGARASLTKTAQP